MPTTRKKKQGKDWYLTTAQAHATVASRFGREWSCGCPCCATARREAPEQMLQYLKERKEALTEVIAAVESVFNAEESR